MKESTKMFSIIIPVYNAGQFIEKCLLSCEDQDIDPSAYEIIVINDGSKDRSLEIMKRIIKKYNNIFLINGPNEGVSNARNKGLEIAQGKYIWCVDADDYIETNCLSNILMILENEKLDALQISNYVVQNEDISIYEDFTETITMTPEEYVKPQCFRGSTWGTIFKREIFEKNSLRFDKEISLAEDQLFLLSVFNFSTRVKRSSVFVYYYNINPSSILNNITEEQLYKSTLKIAKFRFRNTYSVYVRYLLIKNVLTFLEIGKSPSKLSRKIKKYNILSDIKFKYFNKNDIMKIFSCKIFGIVFIAIYFRLRKYKHVILGHAYLLSLIFSAVVD